MAENNDISLTSQNLERLSDFLNRALKDASLAAQIPDGAHLFHGSYNDAELTQDNLKLAAKILLGMTLGYVEDAPLIMLFEQKYGKQAVLDLSEALEKAQAQAFIGRFERQSQKRMAAKIDQLMVV